MRGNLDPIAAEAQLDAKSTSQAHDQQEQSPKTEKAAQALARLVERGAIDPVFAENILDTGFSVGSITAAFNRATEDRQKRKVF